MCAIIKKYSIDLKLFSRHKYSNNLLGQVMLKKNKQTNLVCLSDIFESNMLLKCAQFELFSIINVS